MMNPQLKNYVYLVDLLADLLGSTSEIVLHDVSDIKHSIVKIRNGHITNRMLGGPITDLGLKMIKENGPETILYTERTKSRKMLRCAGLVIRDSNRIIGFLCINMDISGSSHEGLNPLMAHEHLVNTEEHYEMNTDDLIQNCILDALKSINKNIKDLNREDKLHILKKMEEKGIFQIRGAVKKAAEAFSLSNVSIYKHLSAIRKYNKL
jgi:predicted transcriptional regulator YheO